jgi:omega-6 fatty acid desaturase (delta-12 desaturase)
MIDSQVASSARNSGPEHGVAAGLGSAHRKGAWRDIVTDYAHPITRRAIVQISGTVFSFLALTAALLFSIDHRVWAAMVLVVPAAALLVRLFMIQNDCGHGSFFKSRHANDMLGRALGVLTLTPYTFWRKRHAVHHASSGNLERRGVGDVATLTVREYLSSPLWRRLAYRLYRHPLVMFGAGPAYLFLIRHRLPICNPLRHPETWVSVLGTNTALGGIFVVMAATVRPAPFLLGYTAILLLAASIGMWLFYIQHQFEDTWWETADRWNFHTAALNGASFYDLPEAIHWVTCHIGLHHIHHLSSRIPNYRLRECFEHNRALFATKRLSLTESLKCARLALWDERQRKLVSFSHAWRAQNHEEMTRGVCGSPVKNVSLDERFTA